MVPGQGEPGTDRDEPGLGAGEVNVEPVNVVLEVKTRGECVLRGRAVARDELRAELKKVLAANPAMLLIVRPEQDERKSSEDKDYLNDDEIA